MPTAHFERCLALCVAMIPGVALGSPLYHLTDLGALAGFGSNYGTAVNNSGQVAGWSAGAIQQAMQAAGGVVTEIPTGGFSAAYGINNHGLVVGELGNAGVSSSPFAWDGTTLTQLATPTGTVVGGAFAVNDDGVAVGYTGTAPGKSEATVFGGGSYQILPRLAGAPVNGQDWAYGINSTGDIVGMDGGRAFLFSHGVMTPLAVLGSGSSGALAISNNGTAVGFAAGDLGVGNEFDHGVVWREGITTVIDLGVWSMFRAVNSKNVAVGEFYSAPFAGAWHGNQYHALLWTEQDGAVDLNVLIENIGAWTLHGALGISESGLITGDMFSVDDAGRVVGHAFLLTPTPDTIPEPSTHVLVTAGLGLLTLVRRLRWRHQWMWG